MQFITENDSFLLKNAEKSVRNKWRWEWLRCSNRLGTEHRIGCRKLSQPGACYCFLCGKILNDGNNGKKGLDRHANDPSHNKAVQAQQFTQTFPGASERAAPVSVNDRRLALKVVTAAFISENSLPLSIAPKLVDFAQRLARDRVALNKLTLSRTSATYLCTHGLAPGMREELVNSVCISGGFFSLNVDEATNNAGDKILSVLIRYFDEEQNMIVTDQLGVKKENLANAANIFNDVSAVLIDNNLKWDHVVSCLFDNCSTMRGSKSGVEMRIRAENAHLLNISGDTVHMIHNIAKEFCGAFGGRVEQFASDLFYDIEKSPKARGLFHDIQVALNYKHHLCILRPVSSRFLQMLNITERIHELQDALHVFYYSFLSDSEQKKFSSLLNDILVERQVSQPNQLLLKNIQRHLKMSVNSIPEASKGRKDRILVEMFGHISEMQVLLGLYRGILPVLNKYVKLFQVDKPMVHCIHAQMFALVREFLSLFIKPEFIPIDKVGDLMLINVNDPQIQFSDRLLSVGRYSHNLLRKAKVEKKSWVPSFFMNLRNAYKKAATSLFQKLPLKNPVLISLSALSPEQRQQSSTILAFQKLALLLPNVIHSEDVGALVEEARKYTADVDITDILSLKPFNQDKKYRIDRDYWATVFSLRSADDGEVGPRYPLLETLGKALLSVFTGPLVESTFNIMDDIIAPDRASLAIQNYEALSTIKFGLRRKTLKSTEVALSPVLKCHCINAYKKYKQYLEQKKDFEDVQDKLETYSKKKETLTVGSPCSQMSATARPSSLSLNSVELTGETSFEANCNTDVTCSKPENLDGEASFQGRKRCSKGMCNDDRKKKKKTQPTLMMYFHHH